ncbi:hypothetical protein HG536_0A05700 [Torulaspora globosa]|uniref:Uncharacterized protein n=1 Tax=Torulaspora globosa TaxID=48254 RepID=A0A7G3ZB69_9SACH|nr:uncharacterized protein HG536_0A05700 [Torulaspora globosa]QLL30755.1 hypothetical protein HG536_0A05700 [Torulaspora globosa]
MISKFSKRWSLGLMMLGLVIVLWVVSSFLISLIFEDNSYRKPFFITYVNTAAFTMYLLPTARAVVAKYWRTGQLKIREELRLEEEEAEVGSGLLRKDEDEGGVERLSLRETVKLSAEFCVLWFSANFVTNASLAYTSVASQTILSSTSSFFTLFVGALCHVERVSKVKVAGSVVSFVGILLVTRSDSTQSRAGQVKPLPGARVEQGASNEPLVTLIGNVLALSGALLYGVYSTLLKRRVKDESRVNMKIFFGCVGLLTLLFLWPSMVVLDYLGWETFEWPSSTRVVVVIVCNCLITFVSDFCWANAMLLTSPLTVTVGLSVTIPFAMFGDVIFKRKPMTLLYLTGAMLILGAFFIINRSSEEENLETLIEDSDRHSNVVATA